MRHGSLFSGIGGFDLAAEWMGWENVFHCEISEFPRQILKYHFPKSICYEDIKKTDFTKHRGEIDIISGGFPCQPYSNAGKRRGKEDDRHLWPEMLRVIREVQPRFVVGENVSGLITWNNGMVFHEIITDLENEGYETQAFHIPACGTNAPHQRFRIWVVAYSKHNRTRETGNSGTDEGCKSSTLYEEKQRGNTETVFNNGLRDLQKYAPHSNGTEQGNNIGEDIGKKGEIRWGEEGDVSRELRSDGITADTDGRVGSPNTIQTRRSEFKELHEPSWNAAETNSTVKSRQYIGQTRQGQFNRPDSRIRINNFENFPTQSPICSGDDGISDKLDGITFSKWRNESIKGYGNAVVPQVVYQIFKAIEKSILSL
jgi:DNA (cytosine-5)-methyltransferase 1